ncbi:hypothetical protein S7711_03145 [Stachybotrys chartarum IBT 7711]|uniref:AMP-dependent synthetase/ligase domain-containing protein n=1 Tax=Stachybotrys chartarum (strain CBS 109288 / IBT 7711) TaxID=1280523 RepID=A0A084AWI2_STACB|nr:hypothetical protein S7711_03145 [Stachybotrys chartarum IBT 7711]KFA49312.1 hypothetical protein S40293_04200 [Stachybotrys chartarum IBT 40293]KFA80462.1 hypothetical protein S40288_02097 [Stachybotrys chartarum IBT 40288]
MAPSQNVDAYLREMAQPPPAGSPYGVPVPGTEQPNRTPVYRHWRFKDSPLTTSVDPEVQSIHDLLEVSSRKYPNHRCLGTRHWNPATKTWADKFEWISYAEVAERRNNIGRGLREIHEAIGQNGDKYAVGLWSQNRAEWQLFDLGISSQSLFSVALYETLGPDTTEYIINHADLTCVVSSLSHIPTLLKLAPRLPTVKIIVSMDPLDNGEVQEQTKAHLLKEFAKEHGIQIYSMAEVEELGIKSGRPVRPPTWDDIYSINYTSGTTGAPKGVVLNHSTAVSANSAARMGGNMFVKDRIISYLPLAHIYGRMIEQLALSLGASIGYFRGDIVGLIDDMKVLQPTGFLSVPRLYNRMNSAIRTATIEAEGFKGALSRRVISTKIASMKAPGGKASNKHFLYDRIWTPKVRAAVGLTKTHSMISGAAQLDPDVQEFLRAAFGNNFLQGYGLTESYAMGTLQHAGDFSVGNIGSPISSNEICLESIPEMEYTVHDKPNPRGEICLRGPSIFSQYFKNEEETKKAIDADGWFHTGDVGEVDSMGRFRIIDRKKNVLKLAQGEYISPERIENVYLASTNLINAAYVHGEGKESTLVAVFGIDPDTFPAFVSKILDKPVTAEDKVALVAAANHPKVKQEFLKILDKVGRSHKFNSFEKVRNLQFEFDPFTVDNELMTPTFKLKRPQITRAYREHIDRMYKELAAQEPASKSKL